MSEPFIAEVRMWALNFAPRGWAFCNGQLLPIAQNTAFFSLVGTTYGGDGRTTCAVPNLQGRAAMGAGRGPGLTDRRLGQAGGAETVTLTESQIPSHTHRMMASPNPGEEAGPGGGNALARSVGGNVYRDPTNMTALAGAALDSTGGGQAHTNQQPYLTVNFTIALVGVYPARS